MKQLRCVQFNVENLFLFLDAYKGQNLDSMSEAEWQSLSLASVSNKPLAKTIRLAQSITEMNPDILCLNEVGGLESLQNFNRYFLNDRFTEYLIEGNSNRGIDVGYLVKKDLPFKYLLISHKNRSIQFNYPHVVSSSNKSLLFSRDVSELRIFDEKETQKATPRMIILLTHLKSKLDKEGIDPEGRLRRKAELDTLIRLYQELETEFPNIPILVAGDFNGIARKDIHEPEFASIYKETDLIEVFDAINEGLTEDKKRSDQDRSSQIQFYSGAAPKFLQIDYLFLSRRWIKNLKADDCYVYRYAAESPATITQASRQLPKNLEERSLLPSDHYPLVCTFHWPFS